MYFNDWFLLGAGIAIFVLGFFFLWGCVGMLRYGVPFIRTKNAVALAMIHLAGIQKGELVFDLGCGDGRLLFFAEKEGARCVGFEKLFPVYLLAKLRRFVLRSNVQLCHGDFFKQDLSSADVVFAYLAPELMESLSQTSFLRLKRGARVISNTFKIPGMKPHSQVSVGGFSAYLYKF